jgi:hypothetical protein
LVSAVVLTALGAVGCSSSNATPTSNDYDDVAQSTAAIIATPGGGGEIGSMSDVATIAVGVSPGDVTLDAQGSFSGVLAGVTYAFTVSCTDALGNALPHCGATTNAAQASVSWTGKLEVPDYSATVTRSGNWNVTGVQTGTATFNGTGSFDYASQFTSTFRNEQASANLSYNASYNGVVYDESSHLVTGGTVNYTISASGLASSTNGQASGSFTINAVATFANGSATLTLDGSHTYLVSAAGIVTKV